ncbi:MAG: energy transducer TonB [Blastocatellia bacterium]
MRLLLPVESFAARLWRELCQAFMECRRDPRAFLRGLVRLERTSRQRKRLLQTGCAVAVIAYSLIVTLSLVFWPAPLNAQAAERDHPRLVTPSDAYDIIPMPKRVKNPHATRESRGHLGGSQATRVRSQGGGAGGHEQQQPASKGRLATASLQTPLAPPDLRVAKYVPTMVLPQTIQVDPASLPQHKIEELGLPASPYSNPSQGPGKDGGFGNGPGGGMGEKGPGKGAGTGGPLGTGGDDYIPGGSRTTGIDNGLDDPRLPGVRTAVRILAQEKARYTEEARVNKIQGTVSLEVIFGADGRIVSARVRRGLPDGLTETAIEAAKRIRFVPATRNGVPVTTRLNIEYSFAIY